MKWVYDNVIKKDRGFFHHAGPYYNDNRYYMNILDEMIFHDNAISKEDLVHVSEVDSLTEPYCYALSFRYFCGFNDYVSAPNIISDALTWLKHHRVVKDANEGKAVIVLYDHWEGEHIGDLSFKRGDVLCEVAGVNPASVIFMSDNLVIQRYAGAARSHVYPSNFFESTAKYFLSQEAREFASSSKHPLLKSKRFLSYSRHWNEYRQFLNLDLFHRGLLKHGLVSCSTSHLPLKSDDRHILMTTGDHWYESDKEREEVSSSVDSFVDALPFTLDANLDVNLASTFCLHHFLETDLSLINETWTGPGTVFLSEKTWKAMYVKHPFILMGNPGSLDLIRRLGYETFSPIIDESYDYEEALSKRKNMVLGELEKFCSLEENERLKKLAAMQEVTEHNYKVISSRKPFYAFINTVSKIAAQNFLGKKHAVQS